MIILLYSDCSALGDRECVMGYMSFLNVAYFVLAVEAEDAAIIAGHSVRFLMPSPRKIWCIGTFLESCKVGFTLFLVVCGIFGSIYLIESKIAWLCSRLGVGGLDELRADLLAWDRDSEIFFFYLVDGLIVLCLNFLLGNDPLRKLAAGSNLLLVWENLMFMLFLGISELGQSNCIMFLDLRKLFREPIIAMLPSCAQD